MKSQQITQKIIKEVLISLADSRRDRFRSKLISSERWLKENTKKIKQEVSSINQKLIAESLDEAENKLKPGDRSCNIRINGYDDNVISMLSADIQEKLKEYGISFWKVYGNSNNEIIAQIKRLVGEEGFTVNQCSTASDDIIIGISWEVPEYLKLEKAINWVKLFDDYQMYRFHSDMLMQAYDFKQKPDKKSMDYHGKKHDAYYKLLCEEIGEDFSAFEDSIASGYLNEIDEWMRRYMTDKYLGKEPEKKLKLDDPSKLEKLVNE